MDAKCICGKGKIGCICGYALPAGMLVVVFDDGKLVAEIIPEFWLMDHYNVQMSEPYQEERVGDLAVLTAKA